MLNINKMMRIGGSLHRQNNQSVY